MEFSKERFRKLLKKDGYTYTTFSEAVNIPESTIKNWCGKNAAVPRLDTANIIAEHFHVSLDYLYGAPHKTLDHADIAKKTGLSDDSIDKLMADNRLAVSAQNAREQLDDASVTPVAKAFIKSTLLKHDGTNHTAVVLDALLSPDHCQNDNNLLELIYQFLTLPAIVEIEGNTEVTVISGNGVGTGLHLNNADWAREVLLGSIRDRLMEYRRECLLKQ